MKPSQRYRSRREILAVLSSLGIGSVAGCISTESPTKSSGGKTKISSGSMANSFAFWEPSGSWKGHINRYEKETGVSIKHTSMGYEEIITRLQSRILAGSGAPDLALVEYASLMQITGTGGLRDLTPWIKEAGIKKGFPSWMWEDISRKGNIYEIPYDVNPTTLFYRNDVWEKYGINADIETWDQLIEEAKKLPDNIDLLSVPASACDLYWRMFYRQLGGQAFDSKGNIAFNNDKCLRVFQLLERLGDEGLVNSTSNWTPQWFDAFSDGTVTGHCSGAWFNSTLQESVSDTAGKWRGMKLPAFEKGGNRTSNRGGSGLCIPKQVSGPKARRAFNFAVETCASAKEMALLFKNVGNFAAYQPAYERKAFEKKFEFFGGQQLGLMWIEQVPKIPQYRYTIDSPTIMSIINSELRKVIYGDVKPKDALNRSVKRAADQTGREIA
jgi:ABC-type glycerol-3-phosphate transport system substrate-binding protein